MGQEVGVRGSSAGHAFSSGLVRTERPRRVGKQVVDTPWSGVFGNYRELDGVRLPTTGEVSWLLPDGLFTYFRCTLTAWSTMGGTIAGSS
jgi:Family of unknown function (DUF6544)